MGHGEKMSPRALSAFVASVIVVVVIAWWLLRPSAPEFVEVHGMVTLNGKPLDTVTIRFVPDTERGNFGPLSSAVTDREGRYVIRCDKFERDGVVPGAYRIALLDITALPSLGGDKAGRVGASDKGAPKNPGKVSRIPRRYEDISSTPLRDVVVEPGVQEMNFDLTGPKKK